MNVERQRLARFAALAVLVVTCALAFALVRSPLRGIFGVIAGVGVFLIVFWRRRRGQPARWGELLLSIAAIQFLAVILFWIVARLMTKIIG